MSDARYFTVIPSSIGKLLLVSNGECLTGLYLPMHKGGPVPDDAWRQDDTHFRPVVEQLDAYFEGSLREFTIPVTMAGTPFQRQVWDELGRIPFGTTITYTDLASRAGQPTAMRAVGAANGRNPISIIVPCHRVIGASGKLTGYAGGLAKKHWLLRHEIECLGATSRQIPPSAQYARTAEAEVRQPRN